MRKLGFAAGLLVLTATGAHADPRDDALSAIMRCTGIAEVQARLACYDSAVVRVRGAMLAPAAPAYQPVPQHSFAPAGSVASSAVPPPAAPPAPPRRKSGFLASLFGGDDRPPRSPQTSAQQFGSESIASHGDRAYPRHLPGDTVDAITARMVSYAFAGNGRLVVTLDNGQDWIEVASNDALIGHLSHPALYYSAGIERGYNGTYAMSLTGIPKPISVRRLR